MELHRFKSGISEIRNRPISSLRTSLTVTGISCRACVPANKNMHLRPREGILHALMCMRIMLPILKSKARGLCIVASGSG